MKYSKNAKQLGNLCIFIMLLFFAFGNSYALADATVSTVPDDLTPSFGQTVTVSVNVTIGATEYLGAYSFTLAWDNDILQYQSVSGGDGPGFNNVNSYYNPSNPDTLKINQFYAPDPPTNPAMTGTITVAQITYTAASSGTTPLSTTIDIVVNSLIDSDTLLNITPVTTNSGSITIPNPSLTLTSPTGGENWNAGSSNTISWDHTNIGMIKIEYSTDGGSNWGVITSGVSASSGSYSWSVPHIPSYSCVVKISTLDDTITDQSNNFTIADPEISISPSSFNIGNVNTGSSGTGTFTISNVGTSTLSVSSISSSNGVFTVDTTSATIAPGGSKVVTVTFSPSTTGSQNTSISIVSDDYNEGTSYVSVSGTGVGVSDISVSPTTLDLGSVIVGTYSTDTFTISNTGSATLSVTDISSSNSEFTLDRTTAFIAPSDFQNVTVTFTPIAGGLREAVITITSNDSDEPTTTVDASGTGLLIAVDVVQPDGGEEWIAGTTHDISWTSSNVDFVTLEYSTNGGGSWTLIASNVSASSSPYSWTIPGDTPTSTTCKVKITNESDTSVNNTSAANFTIYEGGLWGDVDNDDNVDVADALKIATYDVDPQNDALAPIEIYISQRGDVQPEAPLGINITDAYICASYELDPVSTSQNCPRVGELIGSVAKAASFPLAQSEVHAIPDIYVNSAENGRYIVGSSISTDNSGASIGAASIRITWNPNKYSYMGIENRQGNVIINDRLTHNGELVMARFDVHGDNPFTFPQIQLKPFGGNVSDTITYEILNVTEAKTFKQFSYVNENRGSISIGSDIPAVFELRQNIPNPFNPTTTIQYLVPSSSYIKLVIFNIQGQKIKTLVDRYEPSGTYSVVWDATDEYGDKVGSGIYIYQLSTSGSSTQKQMLLIR